MKKHPFPRFLLFLFCILLFLSGVLLWRFYRTEKISFPIQTAVSEKNWAPLTPSSKTFSSLKNRTLEALDQEFTQLTAQVIPSVVSIITTDEPDREELLSELLGFSQVPPKNKNKMGSGIIVSSRGDIITNWHVIQDAAAIHIELADGRRYPATILGVDHLSDIAILHIRAPGLTPIALGNSEQVKVGQTVVAVGNPFGLQETVTQGIISAKGRHAMSESRHDFFQTSASINPGNSGGPLVDIHGNVIGINDFIISKSGGAEGLAFAIPSNVAARTYNDIMKYGRALHPWFGILMRPMQAALARQLGLKSSHGVLVAATIPESPAHEAGLKVGDLITSFNGKPIDNWMQLRQEIAQTHPGETIPVEIERAGISEKISVIIEEEPPDIEQALDLEKQSG